MGIPLYPHESSSTNHQDNCGEVWKGYLPGYESLQKNDKLHKDTFFHWVAITLQNWARYQLETVTKFEDTIDF